MIIDTSVVRLESASANQTKTSVGPSGLLVIS
jgi:hypothetical protein